MTQRNVWVILKIKHKQKTYHMIKYIKLYNERKSQSSCETFIILDDFIAALPVTWNINHQRSVAESQRNPEPERILLDEKMFISCCGGSHSR